MTEDATTTAVVIVGSAGGIGGTVARRLATQFPARPVWITYSSDAEAAESLRDDIGRGTVIRCDVTDHTALDAVAESIRIAGHQIGIVVHGAVDPTVAPLIGSADALSRALDVSAVSLVRAVTAFDSLLAADASISYLTSMGSVRVLPRYAMVGVPKAAAESIVRYLAFELGNRGIRVNAVGCGPVATKALESVSGDAQRVVDARAKMTALVPAPGADEVAEMITFLASSAGRGVTGQVITVDGGLWLYG